MRLVTPESAAPVADRKGSTFPPLQEITSPTVDTAAAAYYLNRKPQTLRGWACLEPEGVPRPLRVAGRLAWRVADLKSLLGIA